MIDHIVKEINICLENDCYISALGMALTLPDICGKAKYPKWKKHDVGLRYKNGMMSILDSVKFQEGHIAKIFRI